MLVIEDESMEKKSCSTHFKAVVRFFILLLAIFFFSIQAQDVIIKYSEGYTTISTKTKVLDELNPPWISFHPTRIFKQSKISQIGMSSFQSLLQHFMAEANATTNNIELFRNLSYTLGVDFEILVHVGGDETMAKQRLVKGKNILSAGQHGTVEIWMHEDYSFVNGMYYSIEIRKAMVMSMGYYTIYISFDSTDVEDKPTELSAYLSGPNEHFGIANAYWFGVDPFIFEMKKHQVTTVNFKLHKIKKFKGGSDPCQEYAPDDSIVLCSTKRKARWIHKAMKSRCKKHCYSSNFKTIMDVLKEPMLSPCMTDEDLVCFFNVSNYGTMPTIPPCPEPCETYDYTARLMTSDFVSSSGEFVLDFMPNNMRVTVSEEVQLFDLATFIGSVGGSLGLFIGFSFYDFATYLSDKFVDVFVTK